MTTETNRFQSRWGFHPCDYELFLKLKHLHKWYLQTVYDFHRWHRWWRKQEQNRIGPEPKYCSVFVEDKVWLKPVKFHGENGFKVYPKTVIDHGVVELCQSARIPQPEPVQTFDTETVNRIELLYGQVKPDIAE